MHFRSMTCQPKLIILTFHDFLQVSATVIATAGKRGHRCNLIANHALELQRCLLL